MCTDVIADQKKKVFSFNLPDQQGTCAHMLFK